MDIMKNRKFSIPYNGSVAKDYFIIINPYIKNIDHIYFGLPSLLDTHPRFKDKDTAEKNTLDFLSYDIPIKRFLTLNKAHYWKSDKEIYSFCNELVFPILARYHIEGVIISDYTMARYIHHYMPHLILSTSCNTFTYNTHSMQLWNSECGVSLFNPPRDTLRTPALLKEIHKTGFKLKCIVNESCRYGCTQQMTHCFCGSNIHGHMSLKCQNLDEIDILKCNWILPRWLKYLDEYVDIFKIVGRGASTKQIVSMLDAYINERDDIYLDDFIYGGVYRGCHLNLPTSIIPDKLLTCECKYCKDCKLCEKVINQYKNNIS